MRVFEVAAGVQVGDGSPPLLLAGPCAIEGEAFTLHMASSIRDVCAAAGWGFVFKSSFDKANRTSISGQRGVGMEEGLRILQAVRDQVQVPVVTDIHESWQAEPVAAVADVLQIPAFLCRQTDLLIAAARTGRVVNVKKGQFLSPPEMAHVAGKLVDAGAERVLLTERGTSFGYNELVVDFRGLPQMRSLGHPVIFDATHSVQQPGAGDGRSGGQRQFVPFLARAAVAVGVDGVFMEVHEDPDRAPSDGPNMLRLADLPHLLDDLGAIGRATGRLAPTT